MTIDYQMLWAELVMKDITIAKYEFSGILDATADEYLGYIERAALDLERTAEHLRKVAGEVKEMGDE